MTTFASAPSDSESNPFENVKLAFQHLRKLEAEALASDEALSTYSQKTMYDAKTLKPVPSWLQPDTAFLANDCPKTSFIATHQQSGKFTFKPSLVERKFLYRGQPQDYENKDGNKVCVPTLFRDENQDYFIDEMIMCHEMWKLIDSHPLVQLLGNHGVDLCGYNFKMFTNYGGLSQHYFNRTRFLDLTSDEDAAMFFACCDYHKETDAYTPHIEEGIGVIYYYEIKMPRDFQMIPFKSEYYHLSTIGKQIFPRSGAQHGYLMDLSKGIDFNEIPDSHKIYFKHNAKIAKEIFASAKEGEKYMPPNILDEYWKEKLSSSRTDRRISKDALIQNYELNKHKETMSSLEKKLKSRGYDIYKGAPTFTEAQLNSYYQDIQNGWWGEFTKDIFFHGTDGAPYQEAFRTLDRRPEYRQFFYK